MMIKKVLTFRASSIGDCLMAKYLLENIHQQFPDAQCGIVVAGRKEMIKDLFLAYPWIEIMEVNRRNPKSIADLLRNYWKSDLVVTQYSGKAGGKFSFASKLVAKILANHGGLVGFKDSSFWNSFIFDKILPFDPSQAVVSHEREVLRVKDIPVSLSFPTIKYIKDEKILGRFGLSPRKFIVVHLFAGGKGRGLSPQKKKELLHFLTRNNPGIKIVLSGGKEDREELLAITKGLTVQVIAGLTTLQEIMNIIAESSGVVSVDTGVAHIAAHLRKPLLVVRSCLGPNWWFIEQYGAQAPINVVSGDEVCKNGHVYRDYPECLNSISYDTLFNK